MKHITPENGHFYADKGYCDKNAKIGVAKMNLYLATVKKNNMLVRNKCLDKWYSKLRFPYARIFSKTNYMVRNQGTTKNQFAAFMEVIVYNFKRSLILAEVCLIPKNA